MERAVLSAWTVLFALISIGCVRAAIWLDLERPWDGIVWLFLLPLIPCAAYGVIRRVMGHYDRTFGLEVPGVIWSAAVISGLGAYMVWGDVASESSEGWQWWMARDWYAVAVLVALSSYWKAWYYNAGYDAARNGLQRGELPDRHKTNATTRGVQEAERAAARRPGEFSLPL
jgi:hypothetical protein